MIFPRFKKRWQEPCGYAEVLRIAFPLILSTGSWGLQQFIDRMFLTWYSPEAIAASMPAGMVNWTLVSLFLGTAGYVNTFVAQYYGAGRFQRIGSAVWQGIYLAVFVIPIVLIIYPFIHPFFGFIGHAPEVQRLEVVYSRILLLGMPLVVISSAASGFFTGRGQTLVVMWVNIGATSVNVVLDYLFIFGKFGLPELGIRGAGWATVASALITCLLFFALMIRPVYNRKYHTLKAWRFEGELFKRLLYFGLPNGIQFMLEVLAFTIFIILVGKIGIVELAASNIAFNINSLAFLPMFGMSIAVSTLVGQRLGENRPAQAERSTWSAFHISFTFFGLLALGYFFIPGLFLLPFGWQIDPAQFAPIRHTTVVLLRFVAVYSLFDAMNIIFSAAIKGAGDTRFVAKTTISLSWFVMLSPSFVTLFLLNGGLYWLWTFVTAYILGLGVIFLWRFLKGKWREMRVIEQ